MDDNVIALILQGMGISPTDPNYSTYAAALKSRADAESDVQGRWFAEDTRRFDEAQQRAKDGVVNQRRQIDNQYDIAKMGVRNDEERTKLDRWKAEQDTRLREAEIAIQQGNLQVAQERLGIERGAQGLSILDRDIQLRQTPRSWAALADWEAGVEANPDAPAFLQALVANSGARAGSSNPTMNARVGMPEQNSLAATLAGLGVGQSAADQTNAMMSGTGSAATSAGATGAASTGATTAKPEESPQMTAVKAMLNKHQFSDTEGWDPKDSAMLRSIAALAAQGSQKSANRYAMLDKDDQDLILGGMDRLGLSGDRFARNAERQRVANNASGLAA
jgi:hypothetical protein